MKPIRHFNPVICSSTIFPNCVKHYESQQAAAKDLGMSKNTVSNLIKTGKVFYGYVLDYGMPEEAKEQSQQEECKTCCFLKNNKCNGRKEFWHKASLCPEYTAKEKTK